MWAGELCFWLRLLAAGVGGAVGALVVTLWPDEQETRGQVVRIGPLESLRNIDREPWCNEFHHFCIAQIEPGQLVALYTYDTQQFCRDRGYTARWVPELPAVASETGEGGLGVFRSGCVSIYDISGRRLFGPAARDLDRFPLEVSDNLILVDTRTLLCGDARLDGAEEGCERAPTID